eukprot:2532840-Pyramimonas_sp.AAC.1
MTVALKAPVLTHPEASRRYTLREATVDSQVLMPSGPGVSARVDCAGTIGPETISTSSSQRPRTET